MREETRIIGTVAVPTLDDLAREPAIARGLPRAALAALLAKTAAVQSALAAELAADAGDTSAVTNFSDNGNADRLLDAKRAAQLLGVSPSYLYRRKKLPFVVRIEGGPVRFSAKGIERYIRSRAGRAKE